MIKRLPAVLEEKTIPAYLERLRTGLDAHYGCPGEQNKEIDNGLKTYLNEDETAQRLLTIPGVGPVTASLLATCPGDGKNYAGSRDFAASTGLVPGQYSTGGKPTLTGISKRGNKML